MPKSNVCVKTKWVLFNRLQSILLKVLRRVYLALVNTGQWRKKWVVASIPWPQSHKGFKDSWKLCLNLCSLKLLKPRRSRVISLIPLALWQLYTELAVGLINWRIFFLNVRNLRMRITAWNVSKYGVISGPYFPVLGLNKSPYSIRIKENTYQK